MKTALRTNLIALGFTETRRINAVQLNLLNLRCEGAGRKRPRCPARCDQRGGGFECNSRTLRHVVGTDEAPRGHLRSPRLEAASKEVFDANARETIPTDAGEQSRNACRAVAREQANAKRNLGAVLDIDVRNAFERAGGHGRRGVN